VPAGERAGGGAVATAAIEPCPQRPRLDVNGGELRRISHGPAGRNQPPHQIDVFADSQLLVEATDRVECRSPYDEHGRRDV